MSDPIENLELEIFRAGDYGAKGTYSETDLDTIAQDYNPARHEAAVTVDHEQTGPAHGWVSGLRRMGDRLLATLTRLSPSLLTALKSAAYRKRSVELYRQFSDTGRPYLKALTFLGAAAPEVKGLADPAFAEPVSEVVRFDEIPVANFSASIRDSLMQAGVWKPEWNGTPLMDAFAELRTQAGADAVQNAFRSFAPAVMFGRLESANPTERFAENFTGLASPESLQRHNAALTAMRVNPNLTYRDALLASQH